MLRLPEGMRDRLKATALTNNRTLNAEIVSRLDKSIDAPDVVSDLADLERMAASVKFDLATTRVENSIHAVRMTEMALALKQIVLTLQAGQQIDPEKIARWSEDAEEFLQKGAQALAERPEVMEELDDASARLDRLSSRIGLIGDPKPNRQTLQSEAADGSARSSNALGE